MPLVTKIFNGKLNLDTQAFRIPQGDYIDALNITRDSEGTGQDYVVANINGNQLVPYTLPTGINKEIGSFEDVLRYRLYYFIWNSNGNHSLVFYDGVTQSIIKLIESKTDSGSVDILDFNPSFKINHVDVINRDEGDLLSWTDGFSTPKEINVTNILNNVYGTLQINFIEAAKRPPLVPPIAAYGTDPSINSNALRKKLFQFSSAFEYDSFAVSTPSSFSKIPLPIGYYGSDNDTNDNSNNFITITVETGDKNVTDIFIYMRYNIGDAWSDFGTVIKLNKVQLSIPDNTIYQYLFYNDNIYPAPTANFQYVDGVQVVPLFDWLPQKALDECLANGNYKVYGAITENYNNYPVSQLDVTITAANVTNIPPDADPPALTYSISSTQYTFTVRGSVPTDTVYSIIATVPTFGTTLFATYTTVGGETVDDVALALRTYVATHFPGYVSGGVSGGSFQVIPPMPGFNVVTIQVTAGSAGGSTISTEKTWLWQANYIYGLVYLDEQNRDMPGVTTFTNPINSDNDFSVTTPPFSLDVSNQVQTPVISASINHLPPEGAVEYCWVRRRQTYADFLFYETCDYQDGGDGYLYFCLANIDQYKIDNSQFIYGTAPITSESRIKIIAGITTSAFNGDVYTQDYQILGTVTRTLTGGVSPDNDVLFIKVAKPIGSITPAYSVNMLVMIYTPLINPTNNADAVYWEWGETYGIYNIGGINYHRGQTQDQTGSQPALFVWEEGDVYFHERTMYNELLSTPYTSDTVSVMDANFSDFFDSAVNDNGRAQVIEANARHQFNPVLMRFSEAYQFGTSVNGLNRFYPENFIEASRSWGTIRKTYIDRKLLFAFQEFNTGIIPIFQQIILDTAGNPLQADSEQLLNKIQYPFPNQFGVGNTPESFSFGKGIMFGVDSNKGIVWMLSGNAMYPISIMYECNAFFISKLTAYKENLNNGNAPLGGVYTGNPTVYGVFNPITNKYILALEEINRYDSGGNLIFHQDPITISYVNSNNESMRGFESFYNYFPEGFGTLNNLLISFKNGALWTHNNPIYCNFYDEQQDAYIEPVFNDNILEKKSWIGLSETSNIVWDCPEISTQSLSYGSTLQSSLLKTASFRFMESEYHASFLRDINSQKGLINGSTLKGNYIIIKFRVQNASVFVYLNAVGVKFIISNLVPA